jgi:hypothetical protein
MNDFLNSLKDDLADRRMLPLVAVAVVALLAALGFVALGGGSSSSSPPPASAPVGPATSGISVSQSQPGTEQAVAETTDGVKDQRRGSARNPFSTLPGSETKAATATASGPGVATATSSSSSSSSSGVTAGGGSTTSPKTETTTPKGSTPSTGSKPSKPGKPKTIYSVALAFGQLPPAGTGITPELKSYPSVTKATPLPSAKERLIEFIGVTVTHGGSSASFAIDSELILKGNGSCLPSPARCQVIDLKEGGSEQLEYFSATGSLVSYELRVIAIATSTASSAALRDVFRAEHKAVRGLLGRQGALTLAGLRYAASAGVLVFVPHGAFGARAHTAAKHHR